MDINEATFRSSVTQKFNLTEFKFYGTFKPTAFNFHNKKELTSCKRKENQEIKPIKKERNIDQFELSNQ
jgi:hypothetical protein